MLAVAGSSYWYFTRASGAVTLILLTASLLLGIPTMLNASTRRMPLTIVQFVHRNVSLLVLVFLFLHIITSVADGFVSIRLIDAIVPFIGKYRPFWLGLGAVSFDLLIAIIVTSLLRVEIGLRTWRRVHLTSYAMWPIALVHAFGTGSDARFHWLWWIAGLCAVTVEAAVVWRVALRPPADPRVLRTVIALAIGLPIVIGAWMVQGPLQAGWGAAGTTITMLGSAVVAR